MFTGPTDSAFLRVASPSGIRLQEARDRLVSVVDHVVDGIITVDDGGGVETVNPASPRLFGYAAAEMLGQHINILISGPGEGILSGLDSGEPKAAVASIAGTGREAVGRRKDGSLFPVDLAVSGFLRSGRQYFTGIISDISERK